MARRRNVTQKRRSSRKIWIHHFEKLGAAQYFQSLRNHLRSHTLQIEPKSDATTPQQLIHNVLKNIRLNKDERYNLRDIHWLVIDVDSFVQQGHDQLAGALAEVKRKDQKLRAEVRRESGELTEELETEIDRGYLKVCYFNECFETWVLMHFAPNPPVIRRGPRLAEKINSYFEAHGLGQFSKNKPVFDTLLEENRFDNVVKSMQLNSPSFQHVTITDLQAANYPSTNVHFLLEDVDSLENGRLLK